MYIYIYHLPHWTVIRDGRLEAGEYIYIYILVCAYASISLKM